jgi:hypothetical protein
MVAWSTLTSEVVGFKADKKGCVGRWWGNYGRKHLLYIKNFLIFLHMKRNGRGNPQINMVNGFGP